MWQRLTLALCACACLVSAGHDPVAAVQGLITRMLGAAALPLFQLESIPADESGKDVFETAASGSLVVLRGNTGVALATALNNYLKYECNISISWGRNHTGVQAKVPSPLPLPAPSRTVFPMQWRYSWNVCTPGYSFVWYSSDQWQYMIDWMALQGVNLPLAFNGQEKVFSDVFFSLGLTQQEIWAYFSGPAFLPWNRMGNMQAWGALYSQVSGLDEGWMQGQYDLQLTILAAMRAYGMTPVLPGFAGHVPAGMERLFPNAEFTKSSDWCGFNQTFGAVTLLQPSDPTFVVVGTAINKAILAAFGDPSGAEIPHFNADSFNEMQPGNSSLAYLAAANANTYAAMTAADARAVYVMQGWLFLEDFWTYERTQAFLGSVPIGGMLILDLFSDGAPQWNKYDSFFGHRWVWNSLIVFGGRRGIYGTIPSYATSPYDDRSKSASLVGIGVTPEAIDMSQPCFDITFEAGWRSTGPEPHAWLQSYAVRRYGGTAPSMVAATEVLYEAAYDNRGIDESIIEDMPGSAAGSRNTNATGFVEALRLYVAAFKQEGLDDASGPASYDLTDLTRQVLCNIFQDVHDVFVARLADRRSASLPELSAIAAAMLGIISDVDTTDSGDVNFLLGTWLADAAAWGFNASQTANRLFNARNQITLWGPNGEINDYAAKIGWSGLVSSYYLARWQSHTAYTLGCWANATACDWDTWFRDMLQWEQAWSYNTTMYPTTPSGLVPLDNAQSMLERYASAGALAAGYSAHVGYDTTERPLPPPAWGQVPGSTDRAAVGADCPWLKKGNGASLAACEADCNAAASSGCNAVNFNAGTQDCELCVRLRSNPCAGGLVCSRSTCPPPPSLTLSPCRRVCQNPANIQLSGGFPGWGVWANAAPGGSQVITESWHRNPEVLAYLCSLTPACQGFTSEGKLTTNATVLHASAGVTSWVKAAVRSVAVASAPGPGGAQEKAPQAQGSSRPLPSPPASLAKRMRQKKHL